MWSFILTKRQFLLLCLMILQLFSLPINAAEDSSGTESGGGGGGFVHDRFIHAGYRVLYFLSRYPEGQKISKELGLNICRLQNTLRESLVFVINDEKGLHDQRGSLVDAFTFRWRIYLDNYSWDQKFQNKEEDFYHLVFKEMLRAEGSRFSTAIVDSIKLKPFPRELFLDRNLDENFDFKNLLAPDETCLTDSDKKIISEVESSHWLFFKKKLPSCTDEDIGNDKNTIDRLLSIAKRSKCEVKPARCGVDLEEFDMGEYIIFAKSIFRNNQRLLSVPYTIKNKITNEEENMRSGYFEEFLDHYLGELEHYNICESTGRTWSPEIPKVSTLRDSLLGGFIPFEYLRPKPGLGSVDQALLLGLGSQVELVDDVLKTENGFKANFVKVRVINNTIDEASDDRKISIYNGLIFFTPAQPLPQKIAKPGDEGYVLLSLTEWLKYLSPDGRRLLKK